MHPPDSRCICGEPLCLQGLFCLKKMMIHDCLKNNFQLAFLIISISVPEPQKSTGTLYRFISAAPSSIASKFFIPNPITFFNPTKRLHMSNESKSYYQPKEQEKLLIQFYNDILDGKDEPSTRTQKRFLLQLLNTKISQVEPKTNRIKNIHYFLRITVMLFSGVTTILLGLKLGDGIVVTRSINNIALVISGVITFLSGLAVFWDTENYWIRNKIMLNKLKEIRYEYVFYLTGNPEPNAMELRPFLEKFLTSLGDEYWEQFLKEIKRETEKNNEGKVQHSID
jgi:hypothetical protein